MKAKMKLLELNFQRNGVAGEGFYAALVQNLTDTKGKFLITFTTNESCDDAINRESCRVVMLEGNEHKYRNPFYYNWRGDSIASDLQNLLTAERIKTNVASLFDLSQLLHNKAYNTGIYLVVYKETPVLETA